MQASTHCITLLLLEHVFKILLDWVNLVLGGLEDIVIIKSSSSSQDPYSKTFPNALSSRSSIVPISKYPKSCSARSLVFVACHLVGRQTAMCKIEETKKTKQTIQQISACNTTCAVEWHQTLHHRTITSANTQYSMVDS